MSQCFLQSISVLEMKGRSYATANILPYSDLFMVSSRSCKSQWSINWLLSGTRRELAPLLEAMIDSSGVTYVLSQAAGTKYFQSYSDTIKMASISDQELADRGQFLIVNNQQLRTLFCHLRLKPAISSLQSRYWKKGIGIIIANGKDRHMLVLSLSSPTIILIAKNGERTTLQCGNESSRSILERMFSQHGSTVLYNDLDDSFGK